MAAVPPPNSLLYGAAAFLGALGCLLVVLAANGDRIFLNSSGPCLLKQDPHSCGTLRPKFGDLALSAVTRGLDVSFECIAGESGTDKISTHSYQYIYTRYLAHVRHQPLNILEIGLGCDMPNGPGHSLKLWRRYLPHANISFLEYIRPCAEKFRAEIEGAGGALYVGSQDDKKLLQQVVEDARTRGPYDIVVDDGGHDPMMMVTSVNGLWPALKPGGVYIAEDVMLSYVSSVAEKTFMHQVRRIVDLVHCRSGWQHRYRTEYQQQCQNATELEKSVLSVECMWEACVLVKDGGVDRR